MQLLLSHFAGQLVIIMVILLVVCWRTAAALALPSPSAALNYRSPSRVSNISNHNHFHTIWVCFHFCRLIDLSNCSTISIFYFCNTFLSSSTSAVCCPPLPFLFVYYLCSDRTRSWPVAHDLRSFISISVAHWFRIKIAHQSIDSFILDFRLPNSVTFFPSPFHLLRFVVRFRTWLVLLFLFLLFLLFLFFFFFSTIVNHERGHTPCSTFRATQIEPGHTFKRRNRASKSNKRAIKEKKKRRRVKPKNKRLADDFPWHFLQSPFVKRQFGFLCF